MTRRKVVGTVAGIRRKSVVILLFFSFCCGLICLAVSLNLFLSHTFPFSSHAPPTAANLLERTLSSGSSSSTTKLKPWPPLPSSTPWSYDPNLTVGSCEGYFGHGFGRKVDFLGSGSQRSGWFRCFYSETLRSSICEGGRIRMDPGRILMATGGEDLSSVMGRTEEEELPVFQDGAFVVEADGKQRMVVNGEDLEQFVPASVQTHTMHNLIGSMRTVPPEQFECPQWIEEPVLLVTRFEYANLFHTVTDWYSSYVSSRVTGLSARPRVIFVDGHCKAPLEDAWEAIFSGMQYAKSSGPLCFRHAILSPLGYETALFQGLHRVIKCKGVPPLDTLASFDATKTSRLTEFGEMLRASFDLPLKVSTLKQMSSHNVLFVRREDYLAHPRHTGRLESRLNNEQEVFDALQRWAPTRVNCKVHLVNGLFAHMSFRDQARAIQEASLVIGAHGAGLTHIIAAMPQTIVLELRSSFYRRPHFALISEWRGLQYHVIELQGSHANPNDVVTKVSSIMDTLHC